MRVWPWLLASVLSAIAAIVLLVALPASLLEPKQDRGARLRRTIEGVLLIIVGAVLAIPGVPGPGIMLIVLGLALVFVPEKHAARDGHRRMFGYINRLRAWFCRPPLRIDHP